MKNLRIIRKTDMSARILAGLLVVCLFVSVFVVGKIEDTLADPGDPLPGTQAYYDWKWGEAKERAGNLPAGKSYTNYLGASATTTVEGPWKLDINYVTCSNPWNGTSVARSNTNDNNGVACTVQTHVSGSYTAAYAIYTAEEFVWAVTNKRNMKLMRNIDLNGYSGRQRAWANTGTLTSAAWYIDGNGFTVYNYYFNNNAGEYQSLFGGIENANSVIRNITVSNFYLNSNTRSGVLAGMRGGNVINSFTKNGMILGSRVSGFLSGFTAGTSTGATTVNITLSGSQNVHVYGRVYDGGGSCVSGLISYPLSTTTIDRCFSIDGSMVILGTHSNGIAGCGAGSLTIKNTFTNTDMYCGSETGSIVGGHHSNLTISNTYASGRVEGTSGIAGFIAAFQPTTTGKSANISECYTTSTVGLQSSAVGVGGFMSENALRVGTTMGPVKMSNCYAAGEVGSIGTNSELDRPVSEGKTAGFLAVFKSTSTSLNTYGTTFSNCYYDKQTTAMKEWAIGTSTTAGGTSDTCQDLLVQGYTGYGVKGVLTTDTNKSGVGLTSDPLTTTQPVNTKQSFTGFSDNSKWVYKKDHYPQLKVFAEATLADWGTQELVDLVKAYSLASTSTVKLETWETGYDDGITAPAALPTTTYDTVRNLTLKFFNTSTSNVTWEKDDKKSSMWNEIVDVLYLGKTNGQWYCKDFAPGIEWLTVSATVNDQVGQRRLRIIPTAALDPGSGQFLTRGNLYNHADEVRLAYSTGPRINANATDITTGIYPDGTALGDLSAYQNINQALPGGNLGASPPGGTPNLAASAKLAPFLADNDKYLDVYASHLSRHAGDNADTSKLYVKIFRNVIVDPITDEVTYTDRIDLDNDGSLSALCADNNDKFNGSAPFMDASDTTYLLDYFWVLRDGRYLQNGKLLNLRGSPFNVDIYVENTDGTANNKAMVIDADDPGVPDFSAGTRSHADTQAIAKQTAQTSWMLTDSSYIITKLTLQMTYDDYGNMTLPNGDTNEYVVLDPKNGDTISIKRLFQRKITAEGGGEYYAPPQEVTKTYTIHTGTTAGGDTYFYLTFEDRSLIDGVRQNDVESDIILTLTVEQITTGFQIEKTLDSPAEEDEKFVFQVDYRETSATGTVVKTMYAVITIEAGESIGTANFVDMSAGWYTVTELDSNWRFELLTDRTVTMEIEDGNEIFEFLNKRMDVPWVNGKNSITNEMPPVGDYQ